MVLSSSLGFPRIGAKRELKFALESYWAGKSDADALLETAAELRRQNWEFQKAAGIDHIPSGDFSLYDHVLDTIAMVGAVPARYAWTGDRVGLDTYFAMARGAQTGSLDVPAMEMTKWLDTNYHYLVPEFDSDQAFRLSSTKPVDEFLEAKALGIATRPVLLGPVTFLLLGKFHDGKAEPLSLLDRILPVYEEVLGRLAAAGAEWVQLDEPCLVLDLEEAAQTALAPAYDRLSKAAGGTKLLVASYYEGLGSNLPTAASLPVDALHVDLVRAPDQLDALIDAAPERLMLSLGVIDGRNVWRADLDSALSTLAKAAEKVGRERLMVAPSCSLFHTPVDLDLESALDAELRGWLAFARQKVREIVVLAKALDAGRAAVTQDFAASAKAVKSRASSPRIHDAAVEQRVASITPEMTRRPAPYGERRERQRDILPLPLFPTTTIGSFPQTAEVRKARAAFRRGEWATEDYEAFVRKQIEESVRWQEEIGLDVLVHGEFERNDMVQYFGEQLSGFALTQHGWVQSYGSRYIKPPIIYGNVSRPKPMTVKWSRHAQSLTDKPVKGMLTGPVTILQWSFVRDDQPREDTCRQIALAIRDEVQDLEAAGIRIIQIDEPAFREGVPLHRADWPAYLAWAVECFRLASSGVRDETQIHSHMCYCEFNDIIESIGALDADVIYIESARSQMELLDAFTDYRYPNGIGPGIYDIHAPRVPSVEEVEGLLHKACARLSPEQIWVNPDCGLKTRGWEEVRPALANLVEAARRLRAEVSSQ
ncbi:MAG: 5-methyltetrahydropteroyltriglutamate--homocysteine S-methyltransferase [Proteobacteria bacterium]|nr:5-methyltetrahydropteroyltriglutamate--homocysteine S-methyltransferase [Pseudomonadota bacterium]